MSFKRISPQPVVEGGTGAQTLTAHGVLVGEGTSAIVGLTAGATGAPLMGSTGADPAFTNSPVFSGGTFTVNSGTNQIDISSDAAATTVNLGIGAAAKTVVLGSTNTTSATTVQSGSTGINITTSGNGPMTLSSGTGTMNIGADANAKTINIGNAGAGSSVVISSAGAKQLIASTPASSSNQIDFTSGLTGFSYIEVELLSILPGTANSSFVMLVGTGVGPTYQTSAYDFGIIQQSADNAATGPFHNTNQAALSFTGGLNSTNTTTLNGKVNIYNLTSATYYKQVGGRISANFDNGGTSSVIVYVISGSWNSTTAGTAIRFKFSSGTIASGTIRLFGIV